MPTVVGIRFRDSGKVYFFDPAGMNLKATELVIVETVRGLEVGKVAQEPHQVPEEEIVGELKRVIRRLSTEDIERMQQFSARQNEVLTICAERVAAHTLPMRLVKAEYNFDGSRLTFYFTADQRIDFRALVRDLARTFRTRIELRQIGPRDEARLLGGIGPCGRPLCCATFLPDFARVSIKMAKDQGLPLNPSKISGVCGRLLCCLSYEHEQYLEIKAELPPRGAWVQTPAGPGEVIAVNIARETVTVDVNGNSLDVTAEQIAQATALVAGEARSRLETGTAAPVTRAPQFESEQLQELDDEDLSLLEESEDSAAFLDIAEERLPHQKTGQDAKLSSPDDQQRDGRQQRSERQPRPSDSAGPGRQPHHQHPHSLTTDDLMLADVPPLHSSEEQAPDKATTRKSRRRRRRKKSGADHAGQAQTAPQSSAAPAAKQADQDRKGQQDTPTAPASGGAGGEQKRRVHPRRRRRSKSE